MKMKFLAGAAVSCLTGATAANAATITISVKLDGGGIVQK
jgi:hypothetical protein